MRTLFLILSVLGALCFGIAQTENASVLYRKGKPQLVGTVIGDGRLVSVSGDTVLYNPSEVYRVRRYENMLVYPNGKTHPTQGYFGQFSLGIGLDESPHSNVDFAFGHRLSSELSVGLGVGFHVNSYDLVIPSIGPEPGWLGIDATTTSFSAFGRYYLSNWRIRPYASAQLGYGFASANDWDNLETQKGGLNAQFGLGVQLPSRRNTRYFFEMRQYFQKFSGSSIESENPLSTAFDIDIWFKQISLTMGFRFK